MTVRLSSLFISLILFSSLAHADDPPHPPCPGQSADRAAIATNPEPEQKQEPDENIGHVPKRLFGIFPNYRASDAVTTYIHPSVKDKFKIAQQNTFDWPNYFLNAGYALQTQLAQKGIHQTGFGKNFAEYYARAWADNLIGNYTTEAVLPSLLGEDPRYIRMGEGSKWKRTWHALSQIAITRGTNGRSRVRLSELAGNAAVIGVTNLYYPRDHTSFDQSAVRYGLTLGDDAITNLLNEFLPDIARKLSHHH